jgi:hypothetical protein
MSTFSIILILKIKETCHKVVANIQINKSRLKTYSKGRGHLNAGGGWALDFWVPSVESTDEVDQWIVASKARGISTKIG